jgi:hypothetical protein
VIGHSYADAARALDKFKVERIETSSAAPGGEVLAQEPAPSTLTLPGSTVSLQVSDGSLASAAGTNPVTAPATAAAAAPTPAPATDPAPAATAAPMPPQEPAVPPKARSQFPIAISANVSIVFGAGVLLGLLSGALLMRRWPLRRQLVAGENAAPPTLPQPQRPLVQPPVAQPPLAQQPVGQQAVARQAVGQQPVARQADQQALELGAGGVSQPGAAPEIRFSAWLVPGETTIVLAHLPGAIEVSIEYSSDHHA